MLRQPAHAAGRRRADVRPAALRASARTTESLPDPAVRDWCPTATRSASARRCARPSRTSWASRRPTRRPGPRPSPRLPTAVAATPHGPGAAGSVNDQIRALLAEAEAKFDAADRAAGQRQLGGLGAAMEQGRDLITRPSRWRTRGTADPIWVRPHSSRKVLFTDAGWSSSVARWAHNPEVAGSNPAPATNPIQPLTCRNAGQGLFRFFGRAIYVP